MEKIRKLPRSKLESYIDFHGNYWYRHFYEEESFLLAERGKIKTAPLKRPFKGEQFLGFDKLQPSTIKWKN